MQYGSLGDVIFEVHQYYAHTEDNSYIYARPQTIQPPSTTQWFGKELRKINLKLKLHWMLGDPQSAYQKLKELAEKGEPQKLIIAQQVLGEFVIDRISAEYTQTNVYGQPVAIELALELTEFTKKELQKTQNARRQQARQKKTNSQTQTRQQPKALITREGATK